MTTGRRATTVTLCVTVLLLGVALGFLLGRRQRVITTNPVVSRPATNPAGTSQGLVPTPSTATKPSASTPTSADPDGSLEETPFSQTEQAKQRWQPVVEGFGRAFTNTKGSKNVWLVRLKPYATGEVNQSLATVDPSSVPTGHYAAYEVLQHGDTQLAARVSYREGWSTVLYLISEGEEWRVFRYDRLQE